jgi:hypothetical protein
MDESAIRVLLSRLARPHPSGGVAVERAALLAAGADFPAVIAWITAHDGQPETTVDAAPRGGLHGARIAGSGASTVKAPQRYVLQAGELNQDFHRKVKS